MSKNEGMRKRIYERALEERNSNLWNFKRYYLSSTAYSWVSVGADVLIALFGAVITYGLAWQELSTNLLIGFSILIGFISTYKAIGKPGKKSERLHATGRRFQRLHDEIQDFIEFDLKDRDNSVSDLRSQFQELADKRHELKEEAPALSGIFYKYLKWRKEEKIYEEVTTTEEEREMLDAEGLDL